MLVHTIPKNGYESIATCNLDFLGFGEDWAHPYTLSLRQKDWCKKGE